MIQFPRFSHPQKKLFSLISFCLFCFIMFFADTFTLNSSSIHSKINITTTSQKLLALQENLLQLEQQFKDDTISIPHFLVQEQRISWLKNNLHNFKIFESNDRTKKFHTRVLDFFSDDRCELQFFMTWISRANSFGETEFFSIESLFKSNPNGCLIIVSRSMDSVFGFNLLKPIHDKGFKVEAVSPDLCFLFKNTPAELWFDEIKKGKKDPGEIPLAQNLSNLIRLVVLYKYGGVYLDTDFIILRKISGLKNSIGAQSVDGNGKWTRLNNAALVFDKNHPLLYKFIQEFASNFDGNKWGHNGPYLVSRVIERVDKSSPAFDFTVLPPVAFYPVDWTKIAGLFLSPVSRKSTKWVEAKVVQLSGGTYGVHLWNKQSCGFRIGGGSVIDRLRLHHCIICRYNYTSSTKSYL